MTMRESGGDDHGCYDKAMRGGQRLVLFYMRAVAGRGNEMIREDMRGHVII